MVSVHLAAMISLLAGVVIRGRHGIFDVVPRVENFAGRVQKPIETEVTGVSRLIWSKIWRHRPCIHGGESYLLREAS
jgi:hypothetical protein